MVRLNNTYNFTESQVSNLLIFLNRVNYEGLKDVSAINEILQALNNPIKVNQPIPVNPEEASK